MTATQLILVASVTGAILFFAAGAALVSLRQRATVLPGSAAALDSERTRVSEIARLRTELERALATVRGQASVIDEQNRLLESEPTNDRATAVHDLAALRDRAARADAASHDIIRLREEVATLRSDSERLSAEGERCRAENERLRADVAKVRTENERLRADAERMRADGGRRRGDSEQLPGQGLRLHADNERLRAEGEQLRTERERLHADNERLHADNERLHADNERLHADNERLHADNERLRAGRERLDREATASAATIRELRHAAEDRGKQLERARSESAAATSELAHATDKLRDVEQQLADKIAAARDLSTENEQLKGRLRDADALRTEYVRLRTATTDSEYLRGEIARLQQELREVRVTALGARGATSRARPARGTDRQHVSARPTIGESLASVMERFGDAGTRSTVLGDPQGFPLASTGTDGVALAAYAALLDEAAARAKEYLPVGTPTAIEVVDGSGVRVSVWSLDVDSDRLLLANLAVSPVDAQRVETALVDLTRILAPSDARASGARP